MKSCIVETQINVQNAHSYFEVRQWSLRNYPELRPFRFVFGRFETKMLSET